MIDVHTHILWGLDDGAKTREDSLAMLRMAADSGTVGLVATPHSDIHFQYDAALADEREILRTEKPIVGKDEKETWPDGRTGWVSTTKLPLHDKDGRVVGTFGVSRDIPALPRSGRANLFCPAPPTSISSKSLRPIP